MCLAPSGGEARHDVATGLQADGFGIVSLEGLRDVGGFDALVVGATGGEDTVGHSGDDPIMNELIYPSLYSSRSNSFRAISISCSAE